MAAAATAAGVLLTGCGGEDVVAAPAGDTAECTTLVDRLPGRVLGEPRGDTAAAGAAVWGDPAIVLRCGVTPPGPSTDPCLTVDGVDWLFREESGAALFTSFGRDPAVEVSVPLEHGREAAPGALTDLATAVAAVPGTGRRCT